MADPTQFDSGNPVAPAPQNAPAPAAPVVADTPSDASAVPVIGQPSAKPAPPKGTEVNPDPNAIPGSAQPHHGILASIFQDLAGGQKTTWRQTDAGPVPVKENLQPGEMARGILAAALTGLASGYTTRGGPGPAAAAGFQGEQKREEEQAGAKKQQAQQEFQNKNVSDEMTLRKMTNAREQQRSIELSQEHAMHMDQAKQSLEQGKFDFAERTLEFDQRQADRMNLLNQLGARPLTYLDGKPVEEFNSVTEAAAWAEKNAELAIKPGKYNTVFEVDPKTNRYVIMQKPLSWDDQQWLGVQTKNGAPIKDKNGDMIPDGTFKDASGKVAVPAGQMTPHQFYDAQIRLLDLQNKQLTRQEMIERIKNSRHEREKDTQQQRADEEFNRAGGNPDAIDPKTHDFILSPSSRTILQQRFIKEASLQNGILKDQQKELERLDPSDPEYAPARQQAEEARQNLHQLQINMGLLGRTPNITEITANNIRREFTKPDGTYDEQAALKSVDAMQANSGLKQQIRQRLTAGYGEPADRPAEQLKAALAAVEKLPLYQQTKYIGQASMSKHDRDWMLQQLTTDRVSSEWGLENLSSDLTMMINGQEDRVKVPNGEVGQWKQKGYEVVGQGRRGNKIEVEDSERGHVVK